MAIEKMLTIIPISDYSIGLYHYYVPTTDSGNMYFHTKKEAKNFIEFYQEYQQKRNKNGNNKFIQPVNCK